MDAEVFVNLKLTVADPQGLTVKHALESLGYDNIGDVRVGKLINMKLDTDNAEEAKAQLDDMCKKLLANPVIEDYSYNIK